MSEKQKSDFVVSDRRRFSESGEATHAEPTLASPKEAANAPPEQTAKAAHVASEKFSTEEVHAQDASGLPTEAEQQQQHQEYKAGSEKLDQVLLERTGQPSESLEMTFERLVASLYMTAMLQLGLMTPEGEQPRVDIIGARQTIDTLGLLKEKTQGNLTAAEQNLLQQSLFELRMAFLELTNAIARAPAPGATGKSK